jgi:hypothetical protein
MTFASASREVNSEIRLREYKWRKGRTVSGISRLCESITFLPESSWVFNQQAIRNCHRSVKWGCGNHRYYWRNVNAQSLWNPPATIRDPYSSLVFGILMCTNWESDYCFVLPGFRRWFRDDGGSAKIMMVDGSWKFGIQIGTTRHFPFRGAELQKARVGTISHFLLDRKEHVIQECMLSIEGMYSINFHGKVRQFHWNPCLALSSEKSDLNGFQNPPWFSPYADQPRG